ncbi:hypothetical protein [Streptomyces sp. GQFP]|uniref:hypothetical protein n=1 Tax=Streptomyces sp. GQFP TaxID=2907545 RepID=UPI001F2892C6|nr:hypothetical protein [Streptomyces sp. GQFP]UIX34962.1 hypothetical protein LUX31_35935 [Streptomyces sp. GQFP]
MTDIENRDVKRPDTQTSKPDPQTEKPDLRTGRDMGRDMGTGTDKADPRAEKPAGAPAVPPPSAPPAPARTHEARPSSAQSSERSSHGVALLAQDERDKLTLRLQHAVTGFVDGPQDSVEEADRVLAEVTERFTEAVERTRRTVRGSWQSGGDTGDTEKLRLALRDYRELAERLLHS